MIELDWFEQFSTFKSFHFMVRYFDNDSNNLCCSCVFNNFFDASSFISDFLNVNYSIVEFDFATRYNNFAIVISVVSV